MHDLSKFLPSEWFPYTRYFYGDYPSLSEATRACPSYTGLTKEIIKDGFDLAWLLHQHRNSHHWQYWILVQDEDEDKILLMPDRACKEMLADWRGAGRVQGTPDTRKWYAKNREKLQLHPETRLMIEKYIEEC